MATLIKPPPLDPNKSLIENNLQLTSLSDISPDLFTNTRPAWHPPGARGIFGGFAISQCLSAAQKTVPSSFTIHSMHCYFVLSGNSDIPIMYHVEHVREGKSFATRTVQARQRGKVIFTTTMSFVREGSGGKKLLEHAQHMPPVPDPVERAKEIPLPQGQQSPFESQQIEIFNHDSPFAYAKKTRQWIRAKGRISGDHKAHLSALAYMSDSFFIGTVARVHKMWRWSLPKGKDPKEVFTEEFIKNMAKMSEAELKLVTGADADLIKAIRNGEDINKFLEKKESIGMMVSLDHTIYFHSPRDFRADEWMFSEMETPWAGDGRGLVFQKIFTKDGRLIASCVQEGVVRLKQEPESKL